MPGVRAAGRMSELSTRLKRAFVGIEPALRVEFYDRHAEHALDPELPLCDHQNFALNVGDTFTGRVMLDVDEILLRARIIDPVLEVELLYLEEGKIRVVINMPDYLTAKARLAELPPSDAGDRVSPLREGGNE